MIFINISHEKKKSGIWWFHKKIILSASNDKKNDKDRRNVQNTEQLHEENEKLNRLDSKFW